MAITFDTKRFEKVLEKQHGAIFFNFSLQCTCIG